VACRPGAPDYCCERWRERATAIRRRDKGRCRGCNRSATEIRLEVHHRIYGGPGPCGECVLTGIEDNDLVTLCDECHELITDVRRRILYAKRIIEVVPIAAPPQIQAVERQKLDLPIELVSDPLSVQMPRRNKVVITIEPLPPPLAAVSVVPRSPFQTLIREKKYV
jgi:hypothetical protein